MILFSLLEIIKKIPKDDLKRSTVLLFVGIAIPAAVLTLGMVFGNSLGTGKVASQSESYVSQLALHTSYKVISEAKDGNSVVLIVSSGKSDSAGKHSLRTIRVKEAPLAQHFMLSSSGKPVAVILP